MINLLAHQVDVRPGAVVEVERQGNGADVEVFRVQHADSGKDFVGSQHRDSFPSKKGVRGERRQSEQRARSTLVLININIRELRKTASKRSPRQFRKAPFRRAAVLRANYRRNSTFFKAGRRDLFFVAPFFDVRENGEL
jgi:hypothetical protein